MERPAVLQLIFECIASLNTERAPSEQLALDEKTELLSESSTLDSLGFVSLVTDLEERIQVQTSKDVMLATAAMDTENNPFRTVGKLADFILDELKQA